uniref:hypothetical protein n=1 Tax=Thaumasiovibrio occultus TaxID=1891184 RepID=UPI000B3591E2|nr:hypothetical protein [Thaumasiovibrio occultus]
MANWLGWGFEVDGTIEALARHRPFSFFESYSYSSEITHEFYGRTDDLREFSIFIHTYRTNKHSYHQTILSIDCIDLDLPNFELKPESILEKVGQMFGFQDFDFTSYPKFSREYLLMGDNEQDVRALFSHDVLRFFEENRGVSIQKLNGNIIFYIPGRMCSADDIQDFYRQGIQALSWFLPKKKQLTAPKKKAGAYYYS